MVLRLVKGGGDGYIDAHVCDGGIIVVKDKDDICAEVMKNEVDCNVKVGR